MRILRLLLMAYGNEKLTFEELLGDDFELSKQKGRI